MVAAMKHRGPDGSGVEDVGEGMILGHARLSILDLSDAAHQPMVTPTLGLSYNGELYGYRELRTQLVERGAQFTSTGDTEVLHRALELDGEAALPRLDGMFAFAAFDRRERKLLLARDQMGKKPLFFTLERGAVVFASELAALRAAGVELELDASLVSEFLVRGYVHAPHTPCRRVEQLAPGEVLTVEASGRVSRRRYWEHPWLRGAPVPLVRDAEEACVTIRSLFERAVERRLAADVPLGAFLSGGFDSAAVVAVAQKRFGRPMQTFTIGFDGAPAWDEGADAAESARLLGTEHVHQSSSLDSLDLLGALVTQSGEPEGDSSIVPTHLVARLARTKVTVALTGDGGDELFAGYDRFLIALAAARVPALVGRLASRAFDRNGGASSLARRLARLGHAVALGPAATMVEWAGGATFDQAAAVTGAPVDLEAIALPEATVLRRARENGAPWLTAILAANISTYLPGDVLVKVDRATMASSLEARSPLLDLRLMEYACRLAPLLLARGRSLKWVAKRALAPYVPASIRSRRKRGFGAPVSEWFRGSGRARVEQRLLARGAPIGAYVDSRAVANMIDAHDARRIDAGIILFRLWSLNEWLQWTGRSGS